MDNKNQTLKDKLHNIKKLILHPERIILNICNYGDYQFAWLIPDKLYLKCFYKRYARKKLNLSNPKTFNEKLQWLKLHNRKPIYTTMSDKAEAKKYIADIVGEEYIIPTIAVYDNVADIRLEDLPESFVIKCTHDSGSVFICRNKEDFDFEGAKKELGDSLRKNYYWTSREWQYKNIKPRIIVEEFICDYDGSYPLDYKFFCFNGKMQFFKVDYNRFTSHRANYYNRDLQLQKFGERWLLPDESISFKKPERFDEMIEIVEKLSKDMPFLRVDLYSVKGNIYVGELTFYPAGGVGLITENGDEMMGEMLILPNIK